MTDQKQAEYFKQEILNLFEYIKRIRQEIASIRRPGEPEDHFARMSDQLDAIVEATEAATEEIMSSVEQIDAMIDEVYNAAEDPRVRAFLERIKGHSMNVFEACAFQDITGQRITKVVTTLKFLEDRINHLVHLMGPDMVAQEKPVHRLEGKDDQEDKDAGLMSGPQREGEGVSQADIDKLFG